jgi:GNAT superfamily N-acetyltransferase
MTIDSQATQTLRDGSRIQIRPIRKTDVELERRFIEQLSPESRRHRFLCGMRTPSDALLRQLTDIDTERDAALIALAGDAAQPRQVGAARFSATADGTAEVAVVVSDDCRRQGLGSMLMTRLIEIARSRGITTLFSMDPGDNETMHRFAGGLGFKRTTDPDDATQVIHTLKLQPLSA